MRDIIAISMKILINGTEYSTSCFAPITETYRKISINTKLFLHCILDASYKSSEAEDSCCIARPMMDKTILVAALLCTASMCGSTRETDKRHSDNIALPLFECRICPRTPDCTSAANPYACQCDGECVLFNDCCASFFDGVEGDCPGVFSNEYYRCNSVAVGMTGSQLAVYMISRCPDRWYGAQDELGLEFQDIVNENCQATTNTFPPVSDLTTGLVFSNEYCALCYGVSSPVLWPTLYSCSEAITQDEVLTPNLLSEHCNATNYYLPPFQFTRTPPRFCTPHISTCFSEHGLSEFLEENITNYEEMLNTCQNGPQNLVAAISHTVNSRDVFRNEYCALCNGYHEEDLECYNNMTHRFMIHSRQVVSLLLDPVAEIARLSSRIGRFSLPLDIDCPPGTVFNTNANSCQPSVCSFVVNEEPTVNNSCTFIRNATQSLMVSSINNGSSTNNTIERNDVEGNNTQANGTFTCQSVVVIENQSEFVPINQTLIFYKPLGVITPVIQTTPNQLPIVCLDLGIPSINPETIKLFLKIQKFYGILVIATSIISVPICTIIVVVYLLRPMHSVFGVVVINLAVIFLVSDVVLILGGHSAFTNTNQGLCMFAAIAEHFINLSLFIWLAIFAIDIAIRYHRNANSLQPKSKRRVIITYLLIGWIIPIASTVIGITANFLSQGAIVQYGLQEGCHINHPQSVFALIVIPDILSIITAMLALIVILILLCKIHYSFEKRDKCRFVLLFIFYLFLILLMSTWTLTMGNYFNSSIVMLFLPFFFLFRTIFLFFMVAFSKKVLNNVRVCFGVQINPSGRSSMVDELQAEHEGSKKNSIAHHVGVQNEQSTTESSFARYLENPILVKSRFQAWKEVGKEVSD